jgi:geranylgeranyl diphosphate synthase type I
MTQTLELPTLIAARETVLPALRQVADQLCPDIRRVVGYHQGWLDEQGEHAATSSGKALRPALALLSAQAAGASPARGIPAAVAVELVHDLSLLHDDIMDGDTERRHRPAAWTVFGTSRAILAGDALLTAALDVLVEHEPRAARALAATFQQLISGQVADLDFERRADVTVGEYLTMAAGKTAALLSAACSLGALVAGAPQPLVAGLAGFGTHLGLAFQLADDILGIWGDPGTLGKPVLADLQARKKSAPVVAALSAGTAAAARLAEIYVQPEPLDRQQLETVAALIEKCGGRQWSEQELARQLADAERCLDQIAIPPGVRAELLATARFVAARDH